MASSDYEYVNSWAANVFDLQQPFFLKTQQKLLNYTNYTSESPQLKRKITNIEDDARKNWNQICLGLLMMFYREIKSRLWQQ